MSEVKMTAAEFDERLRASTRRMAEETEAINACADMLAQLVAEKEALVAHLEAMWHRAKVAAKSPA